jgi:RNA polymerase sigma factor (sigma-70 family)
VDEQLPRVFQLLDRAKAGDKDAFGALAEEHRQALLRLCFKMTGSREEAEDLVQETLLKAYAHIAEFELRASLSTWLFRIATNACLDSQRARKPWDLDKRWQWFRENGELVKQMEQRLYLSPEKSAEVKEVAATCINCIAMSLPEKQRAAIVMCDQMGLSREEAANSIGASVASLKTELHRARKKMTEVFETNCQLVDEQNQCDGCIAAARIQRRGADAPRRSATQRVAGGRQAKTRRREPPPRAASAPAALPCAHVDELLSDLLTDDLPQGARAGVEAHVALCGACAASYRAMKRTVRFVQAHADVPLQTGTPGGEYSDLTRATMDGDYGRQPVEVIAEAAFGKKGRGR